ncbi:unnamed protein product [Arabidopsis thaliana]|uniref:(thale cress) hypothetical protein n=1 Tax=Arabidopsis thaliana TaxID=3702 RepID=A0A7G2F8C7_ARATH|nr:unnamed protein product [Arabidopsis thaliana]
MSTTKVLSLLVFILFVSLVHSSDQCPINSIYQFGDSISDTGNLIRNGPVGARSSHAANYPYGQTYFHQATGRLSNGLLMIDYLARRLHLPLLNPYLNGNTTSLLTSEFPEAQHSTALSSPREISTFRQQTLLSPCSLLGGNDYNYGFFQGKPMEEIRSYIPHVVGAITAAAREVIRAGAVNVVVPGNFPVGCFPIYLTSFPVKDTKDYDDNGCLTHLNEFAMDHNNQLQEAIASLRKEFPDVAIVYGDYYNAFQYLTTTTERGHTEQWEFRCVRIHTSS